MEKTDARYGAYIQILKEELVPAMGCTEPIALAYGAAVARDILGGMPDRVKVQASGSIIKNVKSVIVPNTGHLKGIPAAAAAGIVAGDASRELEVIAHVDPDRVGKIREFMENIPIDVEYVDNNITFDIIVTLWKDGDSALVRIANYHTNIVRKEKNGQVLFDIPVADNCCDLVLNVFAPIVPAEFARVLRAGGVLLIAVPSERHLLGLKEILYEVPYENEKTETEYEGFDFLERIPLRGTITLTEPEQIANLFSMTPYYWKTSQAGSERLRQATRLETEIGFDLLLYRRHQA